MHGNNTVIYVCNFEEIYLTLSGWNEESGDIADILPYVWCIQMMVCLFMLLRSIYVIRHGEILNKF